MGDAQRLFVLFTAYYRGTASATEVEELVVRLKDLPDEQLTVLLQKSWDEEDGQETLLSNGLQERMLAKIGHHAAQEAPVRNLGRTGTRPFLRYIVAASFLVLASLAVMFWLTKKSRQSLAESTREVPAPNDAKPATDKAVLTLADGTQVVLDNASDGILSRQGKTKVVKSGGELAYANEATGAEVLYNTVATPRGGQYRLVLSDGSRVWLNAGSSLRFPTAFAGVQRAVELTGEGYFEVTPNPGKPFLVTVLNTQDGGGKLEVNVLGTHFNISGYSDEPEARVTLLEGKVQVEKADRFLFLRPGQPAVAATAEDGGNRLRLNPQADLDAVMAWKNGLFVFDNSDLKKILRDLSRWYDVDVLIEGAVSDKKIFGIVNRNSSLSSVMKALKSGSPVPIQYRIEGKKLMVQTAPRN